MRFKCLLFISVLAFLPVASWADTHTADSCSYSHVKAAYDAASGGDIVAIPAGNCTWSTTLTISKDIDVIGAGSSILTITNNGSTNPLIYIHPSSGMTIRVSGIKFDNTASQNNTAVRVRGSSSAAYDLTIRIDHCYFEAGDNGVLADGWVLGVIDNNTFHNCENVTRYNGANTEAWDRPIEAGSSDFLFVEDNTIIVDNDAVTSSDQFYNENGAKLVVRHNTIDATEYSNYYCFFDAHGNQQRYASDPDDRSTVIYEIYENTINVNKSYRLVYLRGGSFLIYNNTITLSSGSTIIALQETECFGGGGWADSMTDSTWPAEDQINNSFIWGNTVNGSPLTTSHLYVEEDHPCVATEFLHEDREYFMHAPQSSGEKSTYTDRSGAAGNGEDGTLSFSSSGANAYYPYTPYTYPHPLRTVASPLQAAEYYVDRNHPSANDQNTGTIDRPWKTITKANQTLIAGDTVYIKAGTYNSYIAPSNSGTSSNPITYRNYGNDSVTISNTTCGILLDGDSHITIQGIDFYNLDQFLYIRNSSNYNTIAYCNFDQGRNMSWHGSRIYGNSANNWIHHCQFSKWGYYTTNDIGSILDIGNEESQTDFSDYNLLENNTMFHGGHHVLGIFSKYNVIRNNYIHNENWSSDHGNRNIYLAGYPASSGWNLVEGNRIGYSGVPPDNWGSPGMSLSTGYNIIRQNTFFFNDQSAIALTLTSNYYSDIVYNKIYNNTFLHNGWNMATGPDVRTSALGFSVYSGSHVITDNAIKNNIYYSHYQVYGYYNVSSGDQIFANNWNGDTQGDPKFVDASTTPGDPTDSSWPDFNLESNSPCVDAGGSLTTITTDSGSGTSFTVDDAGYFTDGWGITGVQGDEIQLHGSSQKVRITNIDYTTNTITVDRSITWTQNQGISLAYEGAAPDIGAHEVLQVSAPVCSGGSPTGILPSGTTSTTLSLSTNENATCRYSTTPGVTYSSMTNTFSTTGGTSHSTTVSGLLDGASYSYCVRCQDDWGNVNTSDYGISFSVAVPDFEPPTIPSNLQASSVSSSQINLAWTASTDNVGVTGYQIYRDGVQVDTSSTNSYSDTGLSPSTTYTYTVSAYDAAGNESSQSSSASATTSEASAVIEAQAGTITSPMQTVSDAEASEGAYIQTIQGDSGTAAYTFNIDESGIYKIIARVYALDGSSDSFYVKIDDGEEFVWHLNPSASPDEFNVWREDEVNNQGTGTWDNPQYDPYTIELTRGTHTITFRGRETNCRLDYFYFSKVDGLSAVKNLRIIDIH